jgi:hypothetical protein
MKKLEKPKSDILKGAKEAFFHARKISLSDSPDVYTSLNHGVCMWEADCDDPNRTKIIVAVGRVYEVTNDWYTTPHSHRIEGWTLIFYRGAPVWSMKYGGSYPPEVKDFVRQALLACYNTDNFHGGRGPISYKDRNFCYECTVTGDFNLFEGHEKVVDEGLGVCCGKFTFTGGNMI